jgi:3-deoxy-D-manno-octulosonate 8-phosphate phosphatase (KDO 8-P phosphatase)
MPSRIPAELRERLEKVRLLVLDVDGVLTDGHLVYGAEGEALKRFNVRDGLGLRLAMKAGITVAILSGRASAALEVRAADLGIPASLVVMGSGDKSADLDRILQAAGGFADHQVAAMGDDLPDLPMLVRAGVSACPADAAPEVVATCDVVCRVAGGDGAVREFVELLLKAQRLWQRVISRWVDAAGGV